MFRLTDVVRHLLIINVIVFLAALTIPYIQQNFALYFPLSGHFKPFQLVTYMFMHASLGHIFFNMFSLAMFGPPLEEKWGPKRFLFYYLACAIGAAIVQIGWTYYEYQQYLNIDKDFAQSFAEHSRMVGASGAIYGLLLAFGMSFPNSEMILFPIPIPIKAKYLVILMFIGEFTSGVARYSGDNTAHFAHIGGAVFGLIIMLYWRKFGSRF